MWHIPARRLTGADSQVALGWAGGGAVGAKLASPERTVVSLVGDWSFLFGARR
jgi:acetolactate synthase-1/2/3 large subunit